jgi:hypothetical protein
LGIASTESLRTYFVWVPGKFRNIKRLFELGFEEELVAKCKGSKDPPDDQGAGPRNHLINSLFRLLSWKALVPIQGEMQWEESGFVSLQFLGWKNQS